MKLFKPLLHLEVASATFVLGGDRRTRLRTAFAPPERQCYPSVFVVWMIAALRTKRAIERVSLPRRLYYTIPVVLGFYCWFSSDMEIPWLQHRFVPRTPAMAISAIVMTAAGLAFAIWARVHLSRNWSSAVSIKAQHKLIRSGPYRFVRHPIYTAMILATLGTALANGKVHGALGVLLVWFGFPGEEQDGRAVHGPHVWPGVRGLASHHGRTVSANSL